MLFYKKKNKDITDPSHVIPDENFINFVKDLLKNNGEIAFWNTTTHQTTYNTHIRN